MTCTRRQFLSALSAMPFVPAWPSPRRRVPMILVWLDGGASHLELFDGKPEAPGEVRGDSRWIRGAIDGTWLGDGLPRLAGRLAQCALIRSLTHGEGNHDRASTFALTGRRPSPVLRYPSLGAAVASIAEPGALPSFVALPSVPEAAGPGFLPRHHGPFVVVANAAGDFQAPDLVPPPGQAAVAELADLLDRLDGPPRSPAEAAHDRFVAQARAMGADPAVRAVFDSGAEPLREHERFGRHPLGRACLLASRLCEGGVDTVLVRHPGWDHHRRIRHEMTYGFPAPMTQLDGAIAAILDRQRERSTELLLCVTTEFGRTPRLNPDGGRDHWPRAGFALLAGTGIRAGVVHGSTDARGEEPASEPCSPGDLFATLLAARGVAPDLVLPTDTGRPIRLLPEDSAPIATLLA